MLAMKKLFFLTLSTLFLCLSVVSALTAQTRGWGFNQSGALGIGNASNQPAPQTLTALPDAAGAAGGFDHSLFLRPDGTLAVSGLNDFGQFGAPSPSASTSPTAVPGLSAVVQASAGGFHSAALAADGSVWVWGYNGEGQIGNGTATTTGCLCVPAPTQTSIADVVQIEAGSFHTLALKADGSVWAWGLNDNGQLGNGTTSAAPTPVPVGAAVPGFNNIIAISAGDEHSLALKADGTVWVWGSNEFGQIGSGTASPTNQLVPLPQATLANITQIAAGIFHNLALDKTGKVFVWGDNLYGQAGNAAAGGTQNLPAPNTTLAGVIEIETAGFTNYARLAGGALYAWGLNDVGQLGNGTTSGAGCQCQSTPVQTAVGTANAGIATGWFHAFSLRPVIALGTGTNQILRGANVRLTLAEVTSAGNVAYTAVNPATVAGSYSLPPGYAIQNNQPAYDVTTTAATAGPIDVCIAGINEYSPTAFANLRILHGEGGAWVDRTQSADFMRRQICARVTGLSPFVIAGPPPPTAANVSVSGRVTNGKSGIARAIVSVTDSGGTVRTARTSSFGHYRFEALPAGQTYTFNVTAKGFVFAPQVVVLNENLTAFDFEAIE